MYDSGVTMNSLISSVTSEADVSLPIPASLYVRTINAVEQFLYTEILKEYAMFRFSDIYDSYSLSGISVPAGCASVLYDDVIRVWADENELEKSTAGTAHDFPDKNLYYTDYAGNLVVQSEPFTEIVVMYRLRPILKTESSGTSVVAVPPEFIELVASRMRGEAYKVANEDGLSAKWLAEYNAQVENFKVWAASRNARYGG